MWQKIGGLTLTAVLAHCVCGCLIVQPPISTASSEYLPRPGMTTVDNDDQRRSGQNNDSPKIHLETLSTGKHVLMLTGDLQVAAGLQRTDSQRTNSPYTVSHYTEIAGAVRAIDSEQIVLTDAVIIDQSRTTHAVPILSKVPYMSRLFRNTGVSRSVTPIPGDVTLDRDSILHVTDLSDDSFQALGPVMNYERIGVDFDFNTGESHVASDRPSN